MGAGSQNTRRQSLKKERFTQQKLQIKGFLLTVAFGAQSSLVLHYCNIIRAQIDLIITFIYSFIYSVIHSFIHSNLYFQIWVHIYAGIWPHRIKETAKHFKRFSFNKDKMSYKQTTVINCSVKCENKI